MFQYCQIISYIILYQDTPTNAVRQVRGWRNLDWEVFRMALLTILAIADAFTVAGLPVSEIFTIYETAVINIVDDLLMSHPAMVHRATLLPWFDVQCCSLHGLACRLERL